MPPACSRQVIPLPPSFPSFSCLTRESRRAVLYSVDVPPHTKTCRGGWVKLQPHEKLKSKYSGSSCPKTPKTKLFLQFNQVSKLNKEKQSSCHTQAQSGYDAGPSHYCQNQLWPNPHPSGRRRKPGKTTGGVPASSKCECPVAWGAFHSQKAQNRVTIPSSQT